MPELPFPRTTTPVLARPIVASDAERTQLGRLKAACDATGAKCASYGEDALVIASRDQTPQQNAATLGKVQGLQQEQRAAKQVTLALIGSGSALGVGTGVAAWFLGASPFVFLAGVVAAGVLGHALIFHNKAKKKIAEARATLDTAVVMAPGVAIR